MTDDSHRKAPYGKVRLKDEDFKIDLAEEKKAGQSGYVVATKALTNENWQGLAPGELQVFRNGEIGNVVTGDTQEHAQILKELVLRVSAVAFIFEIVFDG